MVYFVNILEDMAGMVSMNTHLKGVLVFSGVFDIGFCGLFRYDIMFRKGRDLLLDHCFENFTVSPAISDLVDLCPNLRCNNTRENLYLCI